jgi:hypothetical protein
VKGRLRDHCGTVMLAGPVQIHHFLAEDVLLSTGGLEQVRPRGPCPVRQER